MLCFKIPGLLSVGLVLILFGKNISYFKKCVVRAVSWHQVSVTNACTQACDDYSLCIEPGILSHSICALLKLFFGFLALRQVITGKLFH